MSIIEKFGITPGPWEVTGYYKHLVAVEGEKGKVLFESFDRKFINTPNNPNDIKLIAAAPEMFLWIIGMVKAADNNDMLKAAQLLEVGPELCEKATGKPWEEIKELI